MAEDRDTTPYEIECLERFYHPGGHSIAISLAINEDLVFLPLSQITIEHTGRISNEREIINVTMPMWLATDKRLA